MTIEHTVRTNKIGNLSARNNDFVLRCNDMQAASSSGQVVPHTSYQLHHCWDFWV